MPIDGDDSDDAKLDETFWNQPSDIPNFTICLAGTSISYILLFALLIMHADFGESKIYQTEEEGYTLRNRGTEFNKSPEMLNVAYLSQKTKETYDRNKKVGANSATDIWAIGCLLFELLTGEFLFYDTDWVRFFIRVTSKGQQLITPEKQVMLNNNSNLIDFLKFIFVRDPLYRPAIGNVIQRFKSIRKTLVSQAKICTNSVPYDLLSSLLVYTKNKNFCYCSHNNACNHLGEHGPIL